MSKTAAKTDNTQPRDNNMPLFYTKPTLLDAKAHQDFGLVEGTTFDFTKNANAVPVNLVEMPQVAHFYPIAFARDEAATPVAVLGVRDSENLFVNEDGTWAQNTYIPAYIRRYPFILSESPDGKQLSLCIDDNDAFVGAQGKARLFDDKGKPTPVASNALDFCRSYHVAARQTQDFGRALAAAGILVDRAAEISLPDGKRISFSGFRIIDEEKFSKLPDATIAEWRKKGWLAGVYAQLFSGFHWGTLTRLVSDKMTPAKPAKKSR